MGFYGRLSYIVRNSFRMLEFYHFMKGLHEYIHCTNPITCRFYNFLCQSKIFCLKITKTLTRCRSSLPVTAAQDIRMIYFLQCLSGDFQKENSSATKENKRASRKRNQEAKLHKFFIVSFSNELWINKPESLFFIWFCVLSKWSHHFFLAKRLSVVLSGWQENSALVFFVLCESLKSLENVENRYLRWWEFIVSFFFKSKIE